MSEDFSAAFALLDSRGCGRITMEAVCAFVENMDKPPPRRTVQALYNEFDVDSSGDIDGEEFLDLCHALEKLTKLSVEVMSQQFRIGLLRKLFILVDDGTGGDHGNGIISKDEFRSFFEVGSDIFKGRIAQNDVDTLLRSFPGQGLDFNAFSTVITKLIKGMNTSKVVADFEKVWNARKEAKAKARDRFQNAGDKVKAIAATVGAIDMKVAQKEAEKRDEEKKKEKESKPSTPPSSPKPSVQQRPRSNSTGGGGATPRERSMTTVTAPSKTPPPPSSSTPSATCFEDAFALLDTRGGGCISLDSIYEFCEALPSPPQQSAIRRLYNQFDEDGSGDIDSEEFVGFCKALEKLTGLDARQMVDVYTTAMYKRLFDLVDDSGDNSGTVSKEELKALLESISGMLSARYTAADVTGLIRDYGGELGFDDFTVVVKKLTVGKSISQVVAAFEEARRRRKAMKHSAISKFEGKKKADQSQREHSDFQGMDRLCFACVEKDEKIKEQQRAIDQLQGELAMLRAQVNASGAELDAAKHAAEWAAKGADDNLTGNPFSAVRSVQNLSSASQFKKYPELIKPGLHQLQAQRVWDQCRFFQAQLQAGGKIETDIVVRQVNDTAPKVAETVKQVQALVDTELLPTFEMIKDTVRQLIEALDATDLPAIADELDLLQGFRAKMRTSRDDGGWLLDQIISARTKICDSAICVAPFTSRSAQIMDCVLEVEESTQSFLDMFTVLLMHGSDHVTDAEVLGRKVMAQQRQGVTVEELEGLRTVMGQVTTALSPQAWSDAFLRLTKSLNVLTRTMSLSSGVTRDKSIQTQPMVDMLPLGMRKKKEVNPREEEETAGYNTPRSAAPRVRGMRRELPKNTTQHIDKILDRYVMQEGVQIPQNFHRLDPNGNTFQFGTKRIELVPVDRFVAVKVGGGYLLFDEFCEKYCQAENRRAQFRVMDEDHSTPRTTVTRSSTPTYGRRSSPGATPRTNGSSTPRVLVRTGHGLKLAGA